MKALESIEVLSLLQQFEAEERGYTHEGEPDITDFIIWLYDRGYVVVKHD